MYLPLIPPTLFLLTSLNEHLLLSWAIKYPAELTLKKTVVSDEKPPESLSSSTLMTDPGGECLGPNLMSSTY